ncbi:24112_t:CDS:2, partial [Dentiscutata erythropus]
LDLKDVSDTIPVLVQCQNISDFYVDDRRLFGDWYGERRKIYDSSFKVCYETFVRKKTVQIQVILFL